MTREVAASVMPRAWERASPRERVAITVAAVVVLGALAWAFVWQPLTRDLAARSLRTLDIFLSALLEKSSGQLPQNFVVTLPKILSRMDVTALVDTFELLEDRLDLAPGALKVEFMVETTQSIFDPKGRSILPRLHDAAKGRLTGAHFGTYDYTANCDITAAQRIQQFVAGGRAVGAPREQHEQPDHILAVLTSHGNALRV